MIVLGIVLGGLGYVVYSKKQAGYERGTASESGQSGIMIVGWDRSFHSRLCANGRFC